MADLTATPPHDPAAELQVAGAGFVRPSALDDLEFLSPDDFYDNALGLVYGASLELHRTGQRPTRVSVFAHLRAAGMAAGLKLVASETRLEGLGMLAHIEHAVPTAAGATTHARIVKDLSMLRAAIALAKKLEHDAMRTGVGDVCDWIGERATALEDIADHIDLEPAVTKDRAQSFARRADAYHRDPGAGDGPRTGYPDLDALLPRGLQGGGLYVLAGRPSMGKSMFATNLSGRVAAAGTPALRFSLEMREELETARELSAVAGVEAERLVEPENAGPVLAAIERFVAGEFGEVYVDDTRTTYRAIAACCRSMKRRHGIGLIVVDHLGLVKHWDRRASKEQQVSELAIAFKQLAMDLNLPVLLLCQLNRKCDERDDKRPMLSDLRSSGEIEQSADFVAMLYREAIYDPDCGSDLAELAVLKNRSGHKGRVHLWFHGDRSLFQSADQGEVQVELGRLLDRAKLAKGKRRRYTAPKEEPS